MGTTAVGNGERSRMTQLDGLRGLGVSAVLLSQFWVANDAAPIGMPGIHAMLILSGYLIANILLDRRRDLDRTGGGVGNLIYTLRQFYLRRALRIFPLYYLMLAIAWWTGS